MQSFYARRSQKRKNDSQVIGHFALAESVSAKAAGKALMILTPEVNSNIDQI